MKWVNISARGSHHDKDCSRLGECASRIFENQILETNGRLSTAQFASNVLTERNGDLG